MFGFPYNFIACSANCFEEMRAKLEALLRQEQEVDGMRKSMSKDYREQIKGIRGEIKDLLKELDGK